MLPWAARVSRYPSPDMGAHVLSRGPLARPRAHALVVAGIVVATGLWTVVVAGGFYGLIDGRLALLGLPAPLLLGAALLVTRRRTSPAVRAAALWSAIVVGALIGSVLVDALPALAFVVPGIAVSAFVCVRHPAAAVVGTLAITGSFNTITAYTPFPTGEGVDMLLAGLWVGTAWTYLFSRRERPIWVWPGVALSLVYLTLTAIAILGAEDLFAGLYAFRVSAWYMLAFVLIGYAGWPQDTYRRIAHGILVVAALIGGYATLRWLIGPSDAERELALTSASPAYNFIDGELRLFGALPSGHHLSAWTSVLIPCCIAYALAGSGRWRLVAIGAAVTCGIALFGSEVRAGAVAAGVGVLLVLFLYQATRGVKGLHLGTTAAGLAAIVVIGAVAFSLSAGDSDAGVQRYSVLLSSPTSDPSYQARVFKWESAFDDIDAHPLGQGLGTSGEAHLKYGRFVTVSSLNIDNSYLKVALDQGFAVMLLYIAAIALLLTGLARRAVVATDRERAAAILAGTGSLAALAVLLPVGTYLEGLPVLAAWIVVGLAVSQCGPPPARPRSAS